MEKTLVFADAHGAEAEKYSALLDIAVGESIGCIRFLGDIDYAEGYLSFMDFSENARNEGIEVSQIKGNHDQAWQDYALGLETRVVGPIQGNEKTIDIRSSSEVIHFLENLPLSLSEEGVFYTHAFPIGEVYSGPLGAKVVEGDRRLKAPNLWYYSFGTPNTTGEGLAANDLGIITANFSFLKDNGCQFMVKGHEHLGKIWTYNANYNMSNDGIIMAPGTDMTLEAPAIIQVGLFAKGEYAVLVQDKGLRVCYRQL
jgi:hypothetical protein